jgi:hypothetical protein
MLTKASSMKSRWLEKKIKEELPGVEVIAGLPETTLVGFTSAGGSGTREEIVNCINGGFERLLVSSSWLMPSCDTVMMTPEQSDPAFNMTKEISDIMRSKYGFKY